MINSDIHYLDQYSYIQPPYFFLKEMIEHPDLLLGDTDSVPAEIESFRLRSPRTPTTDKVLQFRQVALATDKDLLLHVMKVLAKHFVDVMDCQLADFLPFGKYGSAPTDELRQRMQHCQLTNLLGEACFADLDDSMFKNRAATLHHPSTLHMGKKTAQSPAGCQKSLQMNSQDCCPKLQNVDHKCAKHQSRSNWLCWKKYRSHWQNSRGKNERGNKSKCKWRGTWQMRSTPKEEPASPAMMLKTFWNTVLQKKRKTPSTQEPDTVLQTVLWCKTSATIQYFSTTAFSRLFHRLKIRCFSGSLAELCLAPP